LNRGRLIRASLARFFKPTGFDANSIGGPPLALAAAIFAAKVKCNSLAEAARMAYQPSSDDDRIYTHLLTLLSVSAALVGVCLTAVGLVSVIEALNKWEGWVDDLLAVGSLIFSLVTLLSFLGIRTRIRYTWPRYLLLMDILFCLGIGTMVLASFLLTYLVI